MAAGIAGLALAAARRLVYYLPRHPESPQKLRASLFVKEDEMETLKTALVVVLLLAVLYGVYVVLNKPDFETPPEPLWIQGEAAPLDIDFGSAQIQSPVTLAPAESPSPRQAESRDPMAPAAGHEPVKPAALVGLSERPMDHQQQVAADEPSEPASAPELSPMVEPEKPPPAYDTTLAVGATAPDAAPQPLRDEPLATADDETALADTPPPPRSRDRRAGSVYEREFDEPAGADEPVQPLATPASEPPGVDDRPTRGFGEAWKSATIQLENQRWTEALLTLSLFYDKPEVSGEQRQRMLDLLDPLAGKVIYSTEHLLEPPYQVRPGETLQQVAERYQLPVALLQNINGIAHPQSLPPGSVLKVLRGPFRAEIQLDKGELVLFLGKFYAGRFAISIGNDPAPRPGVYHVLDKQPGREYHAPDHSRIPGGAPQNPYGRHWLDLGSGMCLHGTAEVTPSHGGLGCISLNSADAADVYAILSIGSRVLVR